MSASTLLTPSPPRVGVALCQESGGEVLRGRDFCPWVGTGLLSMGALAGVVRRVSTHVYVKCMSTSTLLMSSLPSERVAVCQESGGEVLSPRDFCPGLLVGMHAERKLEAGAARRGVERGNVRELG
jgi:hypothetical protein